MAKITDRMFNRIIEGELQLTDEEKEQLGGKSAYELEASLDVEAGTVECSEEDIKNIIEQNPAVILLKQTEDVASAFVLREATEHESSYVLTIYEDGVISSIYLNFEHDDVVEPEEYNASCSLEYIEVSQVPTLHTHIIRLSKTNDNEDYPYITLNIFSFASTYTKEEFEQYVKDVASYASGQAFGHGLICVGDNGGYTNSLQGVFLLRYDTTTSTFIARQCENTQNVYNLDFGSSFPYFDIKSY